MWNKIKGLVLEDESPAQSAAAPVQAAPIVAGQAVPVDDGFVLALRNAIKGRASAYTALLSAADKLSNIIPDPNTRLKAAYATVSGEGRGVKEVLAAIEVHAADLESQRMQFDIAADKARNAAVGGLQAELDAIGPSTASAQSQIEAMTQQIKQLNDLISRNSARQAELTNAITNENARLAASKQQFETALTIVKNELNSQKAIVHSALS